MWISPFVPFETALCHVQSPAAFYGTLPAILKPAVRACLLSSTGSEEEEGWFFDLSITRKMRWLACDCRFAYRRKCHKEYVRIKYLYGRAEASAAAANKWNEA